MTRSPRRGDADTDDAGCLLADRARIEALFRVVPSGSLRRQLRAVNILPSGRQTGVCLRPFSAPKPSTMTYLLRAAQLGAASGLRSMAAPSQLSAYLAGPGSPEPAGPIADLLARDGARTLLVIAAVGEMLVDKLPVVPDRIEPGPLAGRAVLGGAAGGILARLHGQTAGTGLLVGSVAAAAGAFAGYHLRRALVRDFGVPDLLVALCEDAIAITLARTALRLDAR